MIQLRRIRARHGNGLGPLDVRHAPSCPAVMSPRSRADIASTVPCRQRGSVAVCRHGGASTHSRRFVDAVPPAGFGHRSGRRNDVAAPPTAQLPASHPVLAPPCGAAPGTAREPVRPPM